MPAYSFQKSFTAGEIAPALYARVDIDKYAAGAAQLRNFIVDYRGGAASRAGTQFIGTSKTSGVPRLIPFIFSTIAAYALEVGAGYIRFVANGAYVLSGGVPTEVATPYGQNDLLLLKYTQSADVMTFTHPDYPVYNLTRTSSTTFTFVQDVIGPIVGVVTTVVGAQENTAGAPLALTFCYEITAVNSNGEESLAGGPALVQGAPLNQNTGLINIITWDSQVDAVQYNIYKAGPTPSGLASGVNSTPQATFYGYIGSSSIPTFTDNNVAPDFSRTPPTFQDPFSPGQIAKVTVAGGTSYVNQFYSLTFTGDGTGAAGYVICDHTTQIPAGVVLSSPGKGYTHCTVTDTGPNNATYTVTLGQESGTYPAVPGYHQERRLFGGTDNFPESMVLSQPGSYDNFNTSPISQDSDSLTVSLASRQVNAIKAFVSSSNGLVVLTTGSAFLVTGGSPSAALTPSSITAQPQPSSGCNDLPPLVINNDILYCQNRGAVVRDLAYSIYVQSYTGTDRSVLASHLFSGYELIDWTYAEEPFRLVQVVRNDGVLLNFTYVPEQEIFAWSTSDTNGSFMSITSIPEGQENAVYVCVQRNINGTFTNFIERFASRIFSEPEDSWCLDAALSLPHFFPNATINLVGGLNEVGGTLSVFASAPVWIPGNVGQTLWAGGGWADCIAYVSTTEITVQVVRPFPTVPNDPNGSLTPFAFEEWEIDPNVTTISGLDYLDGMQVAAIADGTAIPNQLVVGGSITLPFSASKVVVGLPFQCQLQTLRLDVGDPTIQGRRKLTPALTLRVLESSGFSAGINFDALTPVQEAVPVTPPTLFSDDVRQVVGADWNKAAQFCVQQDSPLPVTVLGIVTEVILGDTQR